VFRGGPVLALDTKGRLTIPARLREQLAAACAGQVVLTKAHAGCLTLWPRPAWDRFEAKLLQLPMKHEGHVRFWLGSASECEIDGGSRVLVAPELREWAGLEHDVKVMGVGRTVELWDPVRYAAREAATLAAGVPEALQGLLLDD
jgi:MraZ protein